MRRMFRKILLISGFLCLAAPSGFANEAEDLKRGAALYTRCQGCHSLERNRVGPLHCDILGRKAGSIDDFPYSKSMRESGIIWTEETLDRFLEAPLDFLPGTTMGYAGIKNVNDRRALILFLASATSNSANCR
ncbi:c-type cytochrome [Hwanghaeella sp.]|uniref:c-type cytochrome n=1 Tax=Hwanghaeella sp. TaxID=2605943 RepID=UPI003CCC28F4